MNEDDYKEENQTQAVLLQDDVVSDSRLEVVVEGVPFSEERQPEEGFYEDEINDSKQTPTRRNSIETSFVGIDPEITSEITTELPHIQKSLDSGLPVLVNHDDSGIMNEGDDSLLQTRSEIDFESLQEDDRLSSEETHIDIDSTAWDAQTEDQEELEWDDDDDDDDNDDSYNDSAEWEDTEYSTVLSMESISISPIQEEEYEDWDEWDEEQAQQQEVSESTELTADDIDEQEFTASRKPPPDDIEMPLFVQAGAKQTMDLSSEKASLYETMIVAECTSVSESTVREEKELQKNTTGDCIFAALICGIVILATGIGVLMGVPEASSSTGVLEELVEEDDSTAIHSWTDLVKLCAKSGTVNTSMLPEEAQERLLALLDRSSLFEAGLTDPCSSEGLASLSTSMVLGSEIIWETAMLETFALSTFFFQMNGFQWTQRHGWVEQGDYCLWHGVGCMDSGLVGQIMLEDNRLNGTMTEVLFILSSMSSLSLASNQIYGSISPEISKLTELEELLLTNVKITSTIPTELGLMNQLSDLKIYSAQLSGMIPSEIGSLTNLGKLEISGGLLVGDIPSEFGLLTQLSQFRSRSYLIRGIPDELITLSSLRALELYGNNMNMNFSHAITEKDNWQRLSLGGELFDGSIPSEIGNLYLLNELTLQLSQISGTIPTELGLCGSLKSVRLGLNSLTGTIPTELGNLKGLRFLSMDSNFLTGSIPIELGGLTHLTTLLLEQRNTDETVGGLSGPLPSSFCEIESLGRLTVNCGSDAFLSCPEGCCSCQL